MGLILIILLVLFVMGAFGGTYTGRWPAHYGYGGGGLGLVLLVVLLVLVLSGRL